MKWCGKKIYSPDYKNLSLIFTKTLTGVRQTRIVWSNSTGAEELRLHHNVALLRETSMYLLYFSVIFHCMHQGLVKMEISLTLCQQNHVISRLSTFLLLLVTVLQIPLYQHTVSVRLFSPTYPNRYQYFYNLWNNGWKSTFNQLS